ncbi:hypothetical protein D3C81_2077390 [compost metagenome]
MLSSADVGSTGALLATLCCGRSAKVIEKAPAGSRTDLLVVTLDPSPRNGVRSMNSSLPS